jgi:hypothetical protein
MKRTLTLLRLLRISMGYLVATFKNRLLLDQEQDLSPEEIDERFRISLRCGF